MVRHKQKLRIYGCGSLLLVISFFLDRVSKDTLLAILLERIKPIEVTPFLDFSLVRNSGVSYGLFAQDGGEQGILIALSVFFVSVLCVLFLRAETVLTAGGLGLIIGGALGNIFDRIIHGAVIDFISLHVAEFYWYSFNIADSTITAGVILLFYEMLFSFRKDKGKQSS